MNATRRRGAAGFGERVYRLLLYAYPRSFRELYADDMVSYLHEQRAAQAGRASLSRWLRTRKDITLDLLRSVPREHLEARRRRAAVGGASVGPATTPPTHPGRSPGDSIMRQLISDLGPAIRALAMRPAFALTVVVTLALGIGANTAVFSLVNGVLLAPLPYPDSDRLVYVLQRNSPTNLFTMSVVDYQAVQRGQRSLDSFAAYARNNVTVTGGDTPRQVRADYVTAGFFDVLGMPPAVGRGFRAGEDVPGSELVVVLSHAFKERHFGADVDAIGETVTLDTRSYTVVGVMPPGVGGLAGSTAELWPVLQLEEPPRRGPFFLIGVGRLADGVAVSDAAADLDRVSVELFPEWASTFQDESARIIPLSMRERIVGDAGNALAIVFGAVALVLLVAVANIANLMLARATDRHREMAVRSALGASRARLARWLIAESLVLSTLGGTLGLAVAFAGVEIFRGASFGLPRLQEVAVDGSAVAFTAAVVFATGLFFGVVPLLFGAAGKPAGALKAMTRNAAGGRRAAAFRAALVASEFALTLPLVAAAGLLIGSLTQLSAVDPGFDPQGVVTLRLGLPGNAYPDQDARQRFWSDAMAATREIPDVLDVALSTELPPDQPNLTNNFDLLDKPVEPGTAQPVSPWFFVTSEFFRSLRIPLVEGRGFDDAIDNGEGAPVVVVTRAWAERFFPGETAVGKQLLSGGCTGCDPTTVVGVVGDPKYGGMAGDTEAVYQPAREYWPAAMHLIVKSEAPPEATLQAVRQKIRALDPELPLEDAGTMEERIHTSMTQPRHWATLLTAFAATAMALATVGIFGVLSYTVRRQEREIGVRIALGANPSAVLRLVLRRGLMQAGIGVVAGVVIALYTMRWLESMLFGVTATDPLTLAGGAAFALFVAALACYLPGRRATRIDPVGVIASE